MLVRIARDFFPLCRRISFAERKPQIFCRDAATAPIESRSERAGEVREPPAETVREPRNDPRHARQREPLQLMTKSFPIRTHGGD